MRPFLKGFGSVLLLTVAVWLVIFAVTWLATELALDQKFNTEKVETCEN